MFLAMCLCDPQWPSSLLRLLRFRRRTGMVHMDDAPFSFALSTKSGSSRQNCLSVNTNLKIIFHPNCIADQMMCARNQGNVGRRMLAEIPVAIVLHDGFAAVKITAHGEGHDLRVQTLGEG